MPDDNTTAMFRVFIEGSVDDVWNEITRTDKPIAAFFNSRMHVENLEAGERFAMRTPDRPRKAAATAESAAIWSA